MLNTDQTTTAKALEKLLKGFERKRKSLTNEKMHCEATEEW
jgi:hypothetical protein